MRLCTLSGAAAAPATGAAACLSAAAAVQAPSATRAAEVQAALQGLDIGEAEAGLRKARAALPLPLAAFQRLYGCGVCCCMRASPAACTQLALVQVASVEPGAPASR